MVSDTSTYDEIVAAHRTLYDGYARTYQERTAGAHERYLAPFLRRFLQHLPGPRVLDVGCGPGRDLAYFNEAGLLPEGIDLSPEMVSLCQARGLFATCSEFLAHEWPVGTIDGVWAYASLTLLPQIQFRAILERIRNCLRPGQGVLALGMIAGDEEGWKSDHKYDGRPRFVARYSARQLEDILLDYFGTVSVIPVTDPDNQDRTYLHAICVCHVPATGSAAADAARILFNSHWLTYAERTRTGTQLLLPDRTAFLDMVRPQGRILDLGSGPGRDALLFRQSGFEPYCFDISEANIKACLGQGVQGEVGDMRQLQACLAPESFDGIWANCSATNWVPKKELPTVIAQIRSIARPGTPVFIGSVQGHWCGWETDNKYDGLPRYNTHWKRDDLLEILSPLGSLVHYRSISEEASGRRAYLNTIHRVEK